MLGIGVSAESQALREEILSVGSVNPDCRVEVPTRAGFLYWQVFFGQGDQVMKVDDNGYGLLGDGALVSERAKNCFQAVVQASSDNQQALWLVHSGPFSPLSVDALVSPIVQLPNHLLPEEHLTRVDFLVGRDTVMEAVEAAKAYLGHLQPEPVMAMNTVPVPFQFFDAQIIGGNGVPDITVWDFNKENHGFTLQW